MVLVGESKTINIDPQASILARTWFLPFKQALTECGVCLPELVEKDLTYFLFGALAGRRQGKIDSLRGGKPRKNYRNALKIIFSLFCPRFLRAEAKKKILFAGNPKSLSPLLEATGGIYFERTLSLSWFKKFKKSGVCQRCQFDYFKIGDLLRALKIKIRMRRLWSQIKDTNSLDDRWTPAVEYLLNKHFPKLALGLYATQRMLEAERPDWILVDEDRTEEKRLFIALGKSRGIKSAVLMHGAPTRWIGFAPLYADYFITWGEAYISRLVEWGIPRNKILVGGSPYHEQIKKELNGREQELKNRYQIPPFKKVMLLALNIYREKPTEDIQGQSISEEQMKIAFDAAVSCLENRFVIVKPHPRDRNKNKVKGWVRNCRDPYIVYSEADIFELISLSDFVVSPGSTVLLDAVYFRKKAIVLDFFNLPWFDYMDDSLFFRAKDKAELESILDGKRTREDCAIERYFVDQPIERILNIFNEK